MSASSVVDNPPRVLNQELCGPEHAFASCVDDGAGGGDREHDVGMLAPLLLEPTIPLFVGVVRAIDLVGFRVPSRIHVDIGLNDPPMVIGGRRFRLPRVPGQVAAEDREHGGGNRQVDQGTNDSPATRRGGACPRPA